MALLRRCVCVCVCVCAKGSIQSCSNCEVQQSYFPTTTAKHELSVCACVCVTPILFNKLHSVRSHTAPLYSIVRTAAMFGYPPHAVFPPSQHDRKTMYRVCTPTAPCIPHVHAPAPGQGPPRASLR